MLEQLIGKEHSIVSVLRFWPILPAAWASAFAATWLCKKAALRFGIVDRPNDTVKIHKEPIAYLGGLGMFVGLIVGVLVGIQCIGKADYAPLAMRWLLAVLAGGGIACFVGLVDDLLDIKPRNKLLGCCAAAGVLLLISGWYIGDTEHGLGIVPGIRYAAAPFGIAIPYYLEQILCVAVVIVFVLGATNSLNLLDGLDGLCAGVTAIITVALLLLSIHLTTWGFSEVGDPVRIIICLSLVACVCGFLPFNRHPAKIFMGDAGSMLLGFMVAVLMLLSGERWPRWWMASVVIFGLPILDTAVALVRRFLNHRPLFISDRGHIYDQMLDRGIPLKKTVAICYSLAAAYAAVGLAMIPIRTRYAGIVYVLVVVVSSIVVWRKGYLKMEGLRGAVHRESDNVRP